MTTAQISRMTPRQKRVVRHSLDVFVVAMLGLGIWLASGVHEVRPVPAHSTTVDSGVHV
ncbi:hypothetical protein [Terracoccus sp. 273MFTsu3.1]|uniref:hypothetical protein n=1 Tax=Terracoccus sp. 273MFTsu3.1 TaxID=1172188 RepID=UPI00037F66B7|nr:hypothetical protein [Terracoccus sp. 273MFTsu3.1]